MTNKLSDRLREEISFWPKTASMVTTLREAMDVVKAWEDAPESVVSLMPGNGFGMVVTDKPLVGKRVKIVEVIDERG